MAITVDIVIAVLLLFAAWRGWKKGAIGILLGFVFFIGAIIIATLFGTPFGHAMGIGARYLQPVVGFFVLFCILLAIGSFIKKRMKPKGGALAGANSLLGAAIGFARMLLILGLLFSFLRIFQYPSSKDISSSKLYPLTMKGTSLIVSQIRPIVSQFESSDVFEDMSPIDTSAPPPIR
jgi:uncharacterized membrane protein required for colicin V production